MRRLDIIPDYADDSAHVLYMEDEHLVDARVVQTPFTLTAYDRDFLHMPQPVSTHTNTIHGQLGGLGPRDTI